VFVPEVQRLRLAEKRSLMSLSVTIRDESSPGRESGSFLLEGISTRITLRDLIRTRVREEVAKANAEPGASFGCSCGRPTLRRR
jgi:hypothetical protein